MFHVTGGFREIRRTEDSDSPGGALTWVEEFRYLGGEDIEIHDDLRKYEVTELEEIVRSAGSATATRAPDPTTAGMPIVPVYRRHS